MASDVLLGGLSVVLGGALTIGGQWIQSRRQQQHEVTRDLRHARREAHQALIREAHVAGHYISRMTTGHAAPLDRTPENVAWVDAHVVPLIWQVQLLSESTQSAAEELRETLFRWRRVTQASSTTFGDEAYVEGRDRFAAARAAYIDAARRELLEDAKVN